MLKRKSRKRKQFAFFAKVSLGCLLNLTSIPVYYPPGVVEEVMGSLENQREHEEFHERLDSWNLTEKILMDRLSN